MIIYKCWSDTLGVPVQVGWQQELICWVTMAMRLGSGPARQRWVCCRRTVVEGMGAMAYLRNGECYRGGAVVELLSYCN